MKCPVCASADDFVLRVTQDDDTVRRTRQCRECGKRWVTVEARLEVHEAAVAVRERWEAVGRLFGPVPGEG